jgi:hypothetical protein
MQKELEQIIQEYGLENTRIQRGSRRIHPQRKGLNATPEQLADLKSVLNGTSVKGFLQITTGDVVIAANTSGAIEKAFDPGLLSSQPKSSEVSIMQSINEAPVMESKTEAPVIEVKSAAPTMENVSEAPTIEVKSETSLIGAKLEPTIAHTESKTPQETYLDLLKQSPAFEGVGVTYEDLQELSLEAMKPLDTLVLKSAEKNNLSRDEAESIIGAASPYIQASVEKIQAVAEALVTPELISASEQTQAENAAARDTYLDLLKQHPGFKGGNVTTREELLSQPVSTQQLCDRLVSEMAAIKGIDPEEHNRILAQGSAYIQSNLDDKKAFESNPALGLNGNSAKMSEGLDYLSRRATEYRNIMDKVYKIESIRKSPIKQEFNYPESAQTLDPATNLKSAIAQGSTTVKESVLGATETLALAQKNMATFAKHVKHRGLKAWAKEQMPILQNKAKELAQTQAAKIGAYVKDQAPMVKDAVISGTKQVSDAVVQYAKAQAPVVAEKAKAVGEVIHERFTEFTQLVDPAQIEKLGSHVLGNDGGFEGNTFDFKRGPNGVDISLKNGTPVFADGKLNPKLDTSYAIQLNKMTERLNGIKPQTENSRKAIAR